MVRPGRSARGAGPGAGPDWTRPAARTRDDSITCDSDHDLDASGEAGTIISTESTSHSSQGQVARQA